MNSEMNSHKKSLGVQWIRGSSNTSYLCPAGALEGIENPTDAQLRAICVDESKNPQND